MSIGSPGRPLATADPRLDDLLPSCDAAWDEGVSPILPMNFFMLKNTLDRHIR